MKKKEITSTALIATACANISGFSELLEQFKQKISISGKSLSTYQNYARHLAQLALHFDCCPQHLDPDQINDYTIGKYNLARFYI